MRSNKLLIYHPTTNPTSYHQSPSKETKCKTKSQKHKPNSKSRAKQLSEPTPMEITHPRGRPPTKCLSTQLITYKTPTKIQSTSIRPTTPKPNYGTARQSAQPANLLYYINPPGNHNHEVALQSPPKNKPRKPNPTKPKVPTLENPAKSTHNERAYIIPPQPVATTQSSLTLHPKPTPKTNNPSNPKSNLENPTKPSPHYIISTLQVPSNPQFTQKHHQTGNLAHATRKQTHKPPKLKTPNIQNLYKPTTTKHHKLPILNRLKPPSYPYNIHSSVKILV